MENFIIAIDQSTSATKAILFDAGYNIVYKANVPHRQFYPRPGWVEHDAEEIYQNTLLAVNEVIDKANPDNFSIAITNQRETIVVWNRETGRPVCNAVVWQCQRGADICNNLINKGYTDLVKTKTGLIINPYFSASGVKWILDNIEGAAKLAEQGKLCAGTIDSWLLWKLTKGAIHTTDYTNASRTMLFNIHTLDWDDDMLALFNIPRNMMPSLKSCDSIFGETDLEGIVTQPVTIAGMLGDSHGALAGQMCFDAGTGKCTYGTGSSVMVNIGETPLQAPDGLVTSVGFAASGKVFYAYEGNIHCTGATVKWLKDNLHIIDNQTETDSIAKSLVNNEGVYLVPAFAGLGAPWWNNRAKAIICGMTLGTGKAHIVRAALEAIAYQVKDLADLMAQHSGIELKELRVDGGPTANDFLMQFQSDMLAADVRRSDIEEASALGAAFMNALARGVYASPEEIACATERRSDVIHPRMDADTRNNLYRGWLNAVKLIN